MILAVIELKSLFVGNSQVECTSSGNESQVNQLLQQDFIIQTLQILPFLNVNQAVVEVENHFKEQHSSESITNQIQVVNGPLIKQISETVIQQLTNNPVFLEEISSAIAVQVVNKISAELPRMFQNFIQHYATTGGTAIVNTEMAAALVSSAAIFVGDKLVDTGARERVIKERLEKQQMKKRESICGHETDLYE